MARKATNPKATNWDKLSQRENRHSIANRDVHGDQQLDRGDIQQKKTKTSRVIVTIIVSILVFILAWGLWSFVAWLLDWVVSMQANGIKYENHPYIANYFTKIGLWKVFGSLAVAGMVGSVLYKVLMKNLAAQNLMSDTSDINQHRNDQHIALPEEVQRKYDWFPDMGAHSAVQISSMISHMMLTNKGVKKVDVAERAKEDVYDEDGDLVIYKGEILLNDDGEPITRKVDMIDVKFGDKLFEASGIPNDKSLRIRYDPKSIPYNPGNKDREKLKGFDTVADLINGDWELPLYEPQRPSGAYITDSAPVNTMVLAITRAGKGQTYIEPVIDMWLREKEDNNMVINDPKGELLVKHYVRATVRGYQVIQFNLINAMKTDIYNPLGLAAEAAREGDSTKCAIYVENIAEVFFPDDKGSNQDPVWNNSANNAFKRAAYGLIDYYLEEEREMRNHARETGMDIKVLETKLDRMWGQVTLYNCYQFFVRLASENMKNPLSVLKSRQEAGEFENPTKQEEFDRLHHEADIQSFLWEGNAEMKMLDLFFNATEALPQNTMRRLISDANNSLKSMAGAEKMLASVYGIAITAMSFFVDPTISTLTSGTPSQNTDLGGFSFPRRMGVRFEADFIKRDHLVGAQVKWDAFGDAAFTQNLGKDFEHSDIISREGWARYFFKGIFPNNSAYLRMRIVNAQTGMLIRTLYFSFQKDYQTSLNGRYFITDPVTGNKIVKNGTLTELRPETTKDGSTIYKPGSLLYPREVLRVGDGDQLEPYRSQVPAIMSTMVRYSEQPKAMFLVTPPHLMKYAKLLLILIKQLVDLNFDKSYMTKENQKPLYKTRYMLDELGNLQSNGTGISGFETMLSIGLGQEQQFTLILQTLQQLRDVYGDSVDKIVQGNTSNIVFLKSTDDTMIDTLTKMSGERHVVYTSSKTITKDIEKLIMPTEGKASYTMSSEKEPVISYNDMAFISERNSIVFRAGDSPVWNRNQTILPMSWIMFQSSGKNPNTIIHPGHEYSLQTIPTLSSALDFDVRTNQPDFVKMLNKRIAQAVMSEDAKDIYKNAYGLDDYAISMLDPDTYAAEIMEIIKDKVLAKAGINADGTDISTDEMSDEELEMMMFNNELEEIVPNKEMEALIKDGQDRVNNMKEKRYAEGLLSQLDLVYENGAATRAWDKELIRAYQNSRVKMIQDHRFFSAGGDGSLCSADGNTLYIRKIDPSEMLTSMNEEMIDAGSQVYGEDQIDENNLTPYNSLEVQPAFYQFLASLRSWDDIAGGDFDKHMAKLVAKSENEVLN